MRLTTLILSLILITVTSLAAVAQQPPPLLPTGLDLSPAALRAIEAEFRTPDERRALRVRHGVWEAEDLVSPELAALAARIDYRLDDPALHDDEAPVELRAEALMLLGETEQAAALLTGLESPRARRVLAQCLEWEGRFKEADEALEPILAAHRRGQWTSADDLTEVARSLALRARLRGEPAAQFNAILQITGQIHQHIDRLHWPAKLVEAELLFEKHNPREAVGALHEVIELNPRCAEAWFLLGEIALGSYDFDSANRAAGMLDLLHHTGLGADPPAEPDGSASLLGRTLSVQNFLLQNLPVESENRIDMVLAEHPHHRHALALRAAVEAIRYDEDGMYLALSDLDDLAPGHPWGYYVVGYHLSRNRQYELAAEVLEEAIRRWPNWPQPLIEAGLMELQSGRDEQALAHLRRARQLDPFNARATFSLHLLESLAEYETVRSENFVVRFDPKGPDRILAEEMLEPLEEVHREMIAAFGHEPDRPTLIELMPNHARFAVRITGVPQVHTIAACTGPVIAMESPREGPGHFGPYDWLTILRHEYVHTITLSQTRNRIPHWLTEAAAVWQEEFPRDYQTCALLARALRDGRLFNLDEITWAFVRPRLRDDRSLAYAQGHWMLEFLIERFGHDRFLLLLDEFALGLPEEIAMPTALGVGRTDFFEQFKAWAGEQVRAWGLDARPTMEDLLKERQETEHGLPARAPRLEGHAPDRIDDGTLADLLAEHPNHPDLLRLQIGRLRSARQIGPHMIPFLERYAAARPVDPLPHQMLAAIHLDSHEPHRAIPYLEELDRQQRYDSSYAQELARQYRGQGLYGEALRKMHRVLRIEPFRAEHRELAAAIAIQARAFDAARRHIRALIVIEPDRPRHKERLEALERRFGSGN